MAQSVTIVGPAHPYKGGVAQHTTTLAQHLERTGHDVDMVSWSSQYPRRLYPGQQELGSPDTEKVFPGTRRVLNWYDPTSWWRSAVPAGRRCDVVALALVNGFQVPPYLTIAARARRAGARVVVMCHNVVPHEAGRAQLALISRLLRSADAVVVHSEVESTRAREMGARDVRVATLPFFFPLRPEGAPVDRPPTHRVLSFGFVRPYKGVDVLIDALALTSEKVGATVAGEFWVPREELQARADERGIGDRVELIDAYLPPEELLELLVAHDALVCSYRSGTGSQQPRIAHFTRTPVIACRVGYGGAKSPHDVDGYLVRPDDPVELAARIDDLYRPGHLERLRGGARVPDPEGEWDGYVTALLGP